MRKFMLITAALVPFGPAFAETSHFPEATETDQELVDLYEEAGGLCNHSMSGDVRIAVACVSQNIYGIALNERGLCRGKKDQANALAQWHKCGTDSLRFPQVDMPAGFQ